MLFYIVEKEEKIPSSYKIEKDGTIYRHWGDVRLQAKDIGYDIKYLVGPIQDAPTNIKDVGICFLTENTLVESNYLIKLISANNLFRTASCIRGKIINDNLDFSDGLEIGDFMTYSMKFSRPTINNIFIPAKFYNFFSGYRPIFTSRGTYCDNLSFIDKLRSLSDVIYCDTIKTIEYFTKNEPLNTLYYNKGYQEAKFNAKNREINNQHYLDGYFDGTYRGD